MPAKLERCVKEVMEKQGHSESRAFAICTAALDSIDNLDELLDAALAIGKTALLTSVDFAFGDSAPLKASISDSTGFLTAPVVLARTGVQYYYGFELGLDDRAGEKIGVYRSPEEVFHPDSIASYVNLVATDDHPSELVNTDNVKKLQIGTVSDVKSFSGTLNGIVTITDKKEISKIQKGKQEVSVGYSNNLKKVSGTIDDEKYEFVQTNIRANHLAIVDAGRCGPACRLTLDHKGDENMIIIIDGIEYNVEDKQLAQALTKQQATFDAEKEEMAKKFKKKSEEDEEEKAELKKEKDKAKASADALKDSQLGSEALNKMVSDRAQLLTEAKRILGDKMPECVDCPVELKTAVIDHVMPDADLEGKSTDYIDATYDIAVKTAKKVADSLEKLGGDFFVDKEGKKVTRDSARENYLTDTGFETE